MEALYEYTLDWLKGSKRHHLDGEKAFIERYIGLDEFDALFGGKMRLADPKGQTEFVGVWGRQAISRLKRILRQRGAEFVVHHADANDRVIRSYTQYRAKVDPRHTSEPSR
ncbi:MAG: hypothetical protein ACJ72H_03495 [Candidatus Sulfotelmatobacter sp.]